LRLGLEISLTKISLLLAENIQIPGITYSQSTILNTSRNACFQFQITLFLTGK